MKKVHTINNRPIDFDSVKDLMRGNAKLILSDKIKEKVENCRHYLDEKISKTTEPIYGITTGFGSLCDKSISQEDLSALQRNLVMSHACGIGEEVPPEIVRLMLFLKVKSLSFGNSGVQGATINRLLD